MIMMCLNANIANPPLPGFLTNLKPDNPKFDTQYMFIFFLLYEN